MEIQKLQGVAKLPFTEPDVDVLLKHSSRTQLKFFLKQKITAEPRVKLLQQSFINAMSSQFSEVKVGHRQLVQAFHDMNDQPVQSLELAGFSQELLRLHYVSDSGLIMSPHNCKHTIKDVSL